MLLLFENDIVIFNESVKKTRATGRYYTKKPGIKRVKRRDSVIAEAKSVIRLPQLTGALRSALLGEAFLFQDFLEEAIKIQKNLDPIPTKRVSWPDEVKKQTTSQVLSTYPGRDFQGGFPRPKPRGNAPRNDGSGRRSAQGGQRGQKR
jgi:hypothetical protein